MEGLKIRPRKCDLYDEGIVDIQHTPRSEVKNTQVTTCKEGSESRLWEVEGRIGGKCRWPGVFDDESLKVRKAFMNAPDLLEQCIDVALSSRQAMGNPDMTESGRGDNGKKAGTPIQRTNGDIQIPK